MMWTAIAPSLRSVLSRLCGGRTRAAAPEPRRARLGVEPLEDRSLPSAGLTIAALGDSLTASYQNQPWGAAGDQNWVQQLAAHDAGRLTILDEAVAGATSADLLAAGGQVDTVAALVRQHQVHDAVLIVGANDVSAHLSDFIAGNPTPFVSQVVANVETALNRLAAAGRVQLVVGDIPDVTLTPAFQEELSAFGSGAQALAQEISSAIAVADRQIEAFAAGAEIPVVDLAGLGKLADADPVPFVVGGVTIQGVNGTGAAAPFYSPDGFHPGTVGQGVLGNAILDAFAAADCAEFAGLRLTDQQILDDAGIAHAAGRTFFDVRPYVLSQDADGQWEYGHAEDAARFSSWAVQHDALAASSAGRHEAFDQLFMDGEND